MKIEYRILWIDDTPSWVELKVEEIREYLLDAGFILDYDIETSYKEDIDFSKYDILAVDYHLDNGESGTEALKLIRSGDVYTEILFYSQDGEKKLRDEMGVNKIDGVYCAYRPDSIEKLKKLIDTTIRKTQEINNLRGLLMAETSNVDSLVKTILLKMEWKEEHFESFHKKINKYHDKKKKKLEEYLPFDVNNINRFVHGHFASTLSFFSLKKFMLAEDWEIVKEYEDIIKVRNFLAHGTESLESSIDKIIINKTKPDGSVESKNFISEDFVELRKKINFFKNKFEEIDKNL